MSHRFDYFVGITWFTISLVVGALNDVAMKWLGSRLPSMEIAFLRFFFSTLVLLPVMLYYGKPAFYTSRITIHALRGLLLFGAIALWCYGLTKVHMTAAVVINFTIPLFVLVLAMIFLGEKVGPTRWIATVIGFSGVIVVLNPTDLHFNIAGGMLVLGSFMFALLDILNKKYVVQESTLSMLFYSAAFTTILGFIPAYMVWVAPTSQEFLILFVLGAGANLLLYCLLRAFALIDASAVSPFRYTELFISAGFGYLFFTEIPTLSTILGACIVIPSTMFVAYQESRGNAREKLKAEC